MNERVRRLQARITQLPKVPPRTPQYDRFLRKIDHYRAELDYRDRKAESEGRGRLETLEPPEPLPPPTLDDLKIDLEASLHFVNEYIPSQRGGDRLPENQALADQMERHARDEITRLRTEIRAKEGSPA